MRISDWSSDVCSSDLDLGGDIRQSRAQVRRCREPNAGIDKGDIAEHVPCQDCSCQLYARTQPDLNRVRLAHHVGIGNHQSRLADEKAGPVPLPDADRDDSVPHPVGIKPNACAAVHDRISAGCRLRRSMGDCETFFQSIDLGITREPRYRIGKSAVRSAEHTSELQSLMRTSYA